MRVMVLLGGLDRVCRLVRGDHFVLNAVGNWKGSVWLLCAESGQGL